MACPQPIPHTRLSNEILEKLAMIRISGEARQMLDVILRKTYGWGKKNDDIATSQFVQLTGLKAFAVHKARKKLQDMNLITVTKKGDRVTQKGYSQVLNYTFQKDYDKWLPLPKKVTVTKKGIQVSPKKVTNCNQKRGTQKKVKETNTKDSKPERARLSDIDFVKSLKTNPAYKGIDIEKELYKMDAWFLTHTGRQKTQRNATDKNRIDKNKDNIDLIVTDLNCVLGTNYKTTSTKTADLIDYRINDGFTVEDFKKVHRNMLLAWGADNKMVKYLRPETLYGTKFESYLNQKDNNAKPKSRTDL